MPSGRIFIIAIKASHSSEGLPPKMKKLYIRFAYLGKIIMNQPSLENPLNIQRDVLKSV